MTEKRRLGDRGEDYTARYLQKQGYELVTVSELVEAKHGETPQKGKIYGYSYFK